MVPEAWRTTARSMVVEDRWIRLRADDCVDADGRTIAPYYVLEQAEWVSIVALTDEGYAVAIEEYHHGAGVVGVGLPGGAVDATEFPSAAASRELAEETGYVADEIVDLGWSWANWGNQDNRVHHFLARGCRHDRPQEFDAGETIDVRIVPFAELGEQLAQSYHQLTWFKADARLSG
ncbi:NUDIX hydrolase [Microbacterium saperdae]